MTHVLENPRRAPRVPVVLEASVMHPHGLFDAVTADFGPRGCLLVSGRPPKEGTRVVIVVRASDLEEALDVSGSIAWQAGSRCGVRFAIAPRDPQPKSWYEQLLARRPELQEIARRMTARAPDRVAWDDLLSRAAAAIDPQRLTPDEERVLAHTRVRTPLHVVAHHARLPPHYFGRALFALIEKGFLVVGDPRPRARVTAGRAAPPAPTPPSDAGPPGTAASANPTVPAGREPASR